MCRRFKSAPAQFLGAASGHCNICGIVRDRVLSVHFMNAQRLAACLGLGPISFSHGCIGWNKLQMDGPHQGGRDFKRGFSAKQFVPGSALTFLEERDRLIPESGRVSCRSQ